MGISVPELIRQVGISEQTFYRWKKRYTGLEVDQVRQLKQLQEENVRLKRVVADLTLDKVIRHQRTTGLSSSASAWFDAALSEPQGSADGVAAAASGDRPGSSPLRLSKDPGAAEPRGLERGPKTGGSVVSGGGLDPASKAATPGSGGRTPARAKKAGRAQ